MAKIMLAFLVGLNLAMSWLLTVILGQINEIMMLWPIASSLLTGVLGITFFVSYWDD